MPLSDALARSLHTELMTRLERLLLAWSDWDPTARGWFSVAILSRALMLVEELTVLLTAQTGEED